jgi:single-stranded-DNA-specific exonuclease
MGSSQWKPAEVHAEEIQRLQRRGLPRAIALLLAARGIAADVVDGFFDTSLSSLSDPFRIPGIREAAARLWEAIHRREPVAIHGDYDTDGVTATTLLAWVLRENGASVSCFLPDRFDDGYGFTPESLVKAVTETGARLLVTVDCGITSVEAAAAARALGVELIITDHHEPLPGMLPPVPIIVNPKLHAETADLSLLAGVGVAFKLCHGFLKYGREQGFGGDRPDLREGLDLVALGTIADIVPLIGENRTLVRHGLTVLQRQRRPGIRALCELARIESEIKPSHVAFQLAPRLNAAGRLGNPATALALLNADSMGTAHQCARQLDDFNRRRQSTEGLIYAEAERQLGSMADLKDRYSLVVAGPDWHLGVIGIVASRLSREYHRPALVLSISEGRAIGSGRSIDPLDLIVVLGACRDLTERFGGHPMAAGLAMPERELPAFKRRFEEAVRTHLQPHHLVPRVAYDGEAGLDEIDADYFAAIADLEPFGNGNPRPVFRFNRVRPQRLAAAAERHSRGILADARDNTMPFIAFGRDLQSLPNGGAWDVLATPQLNTFRGEENPQLEIVDLRPSES